MKIIRWSTRTRDPESQAASGQRLRVTTVHVTFYVGVPEVAAALRKVESLGGKTMRGPDAVPGGPTIGLFEDPGGHVIGVVQTGS